MREAKPLAGRPILRELRARTLAYVLPVSMPSADVCRRRLRAGTFRTDLDADFPSVRLRSRSPRIDVVAHARQDGRARRYRAGAQYRVHGRWRRDRIVRRRRDIERPIHLCLRRGADPGATFIRVARPGRARRAGHPDRDPRRPAATIRSMPRSSCRSATGRRSNASRSARGRGGCMSPADGHGRCEGAVRDFAFTTGSAVTRNQLFVSFGGDASKVRIAGAICSRIASTSTPRW